MKKLLLVLTLSVLASLPVLAALKAGESAPDFSARASLAGKEFNFSLQDALKKGPVVLYFYPSAFTKGCDLEAHTFAESKDKFDAAGATIIGVSADSIERLDAFSSDPSYCAGKFPVASDATHQIAASYNLTLTAAEGGRNRCARCRDWPRLDRAHHLRHRQGPQDHRDSLLQRRRSRTRSARREIIGDRAATHLEIICCRRGNPRSVEIP